MNDEYFKEHAKKVWEIAEKADPFTKKRLFDLAAAYERRPRPPTPLPSVAVEKQANDNNGSRDSG